MVAQAKAMFILYRTTYLGATRYSKQRRPGAAHKSFTHLERRAGAVDREGLVH